MGGESGSQTITIATDGAYQLQSAITTYIGDITPFVLGILGAALGIGLLFWVVRLFLRGSKTASR